jgi:hypothetical protein
MLFCYEYICVDLVNQPECLLYDIRRLCALVFHYFNFLNFYAHLYVSLGEILGLTKI